MIHYELFWLFQIGYKASEIIRRFGYAHSTTYRMWKEYRRSKNRAKALIECALSGSLTDQKKTNNLDDLP